MKRVITLLLVCLLALTGCSPNPTPEATSDEVIEIKEKMFIAQTNDIYVNASDYLGKTIKYEGIFASQTSSEQTYYMVIRFGPGCCGDDGNVGFEVTWDKHYPNPNDWVEAVGVLEEYEENGYNYLRLALISLTGLSERGAELVTQ
jgi:Predicted membrane protein